MAAKRKSFFITYWHEISDTAMKIRLLLIALLATSAALASMYLLGIVGKTIENGGPEGPYTIWIFLGLSLFLPVLLFQSETIVMKMGNKVIIDLQIRLCRNILRVPYRMLEKIGAAKILVILQEDVTTISKTITQIVVLFTQSAFLVAGVGYLLWLSPTLFTWSFVGVVVGVIGYRLLTIPGWGLMMAGRTESMERYNHYKGLYEGNKELKLNRKRGKAFFDTIFLPTLKRHRDFTARGHFFYAMAKGWGQIIYFMVLGLLIFVVPRYQNVAELPLLQYGLVLLYLVSPLQMVMEFIYQLGKAKVSIQKISELGLTLSENAPSHDPAANDHENPDWQTISLEGVTFTYEAHDEEQPFSVGPIDLEVERGELLYLVGGNGSGKTTLAKILVGLYEPDEGRILLDGKPVDAAQREGYRQNFSTVFTDYYLFESLLGLEAEDLDERARDYLRKLEIDHKVTIDDGRLSTTHLSQGQRKRLALLTAYLEDRPCYVFDEWAADQDVLFREVFYKELLPDLKRRNKAVLVISHDDKYFHAADRLVKLEYGKLGSGEPGAAKVTRSVSP